MKKRLCAFVLAIVLSVLCAMPVSAHPKAEQHWKDLRKVLFGKTVTTRSATSNRRALELLERASALAIDQFDSGNHPNGTISGTEHLQELRSNEDEYNIVGLPLSISCISFESNAYEHRLYTHKGWKFKYADNDNVKLDAGKVKDCNWSARQRIMLATAEAVFAFEKNQKADINASNIINFNEAKKKLQDATTVITGNYDIKCEAFCRLLYCVHILGDHQENDGREDSEIISIDDIIDELIAVSDILFESQRTDKGKLVDELEKRKGQDGTAKDRATDVLNLLPEHIPALLKEEPFFQSAFYPNDYEIYKQNAA